MSEFIYTNELPINEDMIALYDRSLFLLYSHWCGDSSLTVQSEVSTNKHVLTSTQMKYEEFSTLLCRKTFYNLRCSTNYTTHPITKELTIEADVINTVLTSIAATKFTYQRMNHYLQVFILLYCGCIRHENFTCGVELLTNKLKMRDQTAADAIKFMINNGWFRITKESCDIPNQRRSRCFAISQELLSNALLNADWMRGHFFDPNKPENIKDNIFIDRDTPLTACDDLTGEPIISFDCGETARLWLMIGGFKVSDFFGYSIYNSIKKDEALCFFKWKVGALTSVISNPDEKQEFNRYYFYELPVMDMSNGVRYDNAVQAAEMTSIRAGWIIRACRKITKTAGKKEWDFII